MTKYVVVWVDHKGKTKRCKDNDCKLFDTYEQADSLRRTLSNAYYNLAYYVLAAPNEDYCLAGEW